MGWWWGGGWARVFSSPLVLTHPPSHPHHQPYLAWLKKLSFAAYAYAALVKNEFGDLKLPPVRGAPPAPADRMIPRNIDNGLSIVADVGILLGFLVTLRVIGFCLFAHAVRTRRL